VFTSMAGAYKKRKLYINLLKGVNFF
jgi:hypothetical protein